MQTVSFSEALDQIVAKDPRYDREAYAFLRDALDFTIKKHRKTHKSEVVDVSAADLLDGFRLYALKEFGPMAAAVLGYWGVRSCEDVGNLVFNLVEANVFSKTDRDTREAFRNGFDFDEAFCEPFRPQGKKLSKSPSPAVERGS